MNVSDISYDQTEGSPRTRDGSTIHCGAVTVDPLKWSDVDIRAEDAITANHPVINKSPRNGRVFKLDGSLRTIEKWRAPRKNIVHFRLISADNDPDLRFNYNSKDVVTLQEDLKEELYSVDDRWLLEELGAPELEFCGRL